MMVCIDVVNLFSSFPNIGTIAFTYKLFHSYNLYNNEKIVFIIKLKFVLPQNFLQFENKTYNVRA